MSKDMQKSLAVSSYKRYKGHWERFKAFYRKHYNRSQYLATKHQLGIYVTYLHGQSLKSKTIGSHLSSIAFFFRLKGIHSPTESYYTKTLLRSYSKLSQPISIRKPITINILRDMVRVIGLHYFDDYTRLMLRSLFTIMYHALLRVSEISYSKENSHNLQMHNMKLGNKSRSLTIRFSSYKCSTNIVPMRIKRTNATDPYSFADPVRIFTDYLYIRGHSDGPVYRHQDGSPLSRLFVKGELTKVLELIGKDQSEFNTHSFRIGRATDMFKEGQSEVKIQLAGRWKSNAFKKYIKPSLVHL